MTLSVIRAPSRRMLEKNVLEEDRDTGEIEVKEDTLEEDTSNIFGISSNYVSISDETRLRTEDPICLALAEDCDKLKILMDFSAREKYKVSQTASIVRTHAATLKSLGSRLDEVAGREQKRVELATISFVVGLLRDVMRETGVQVESREIIMQNLLSRISNQQEIAVH